MTALLDAHVHVWDPTRLDYPWLAAEEALRRPFGPADLDTGTYRLAGMVVVEAGVRTDLAAAEVSWIEALAARSPSPSVRGVVAQAPLEYGPDASASLSGPFVLGVRRNVQDEPPGFLSEPAFVAGVAALAGRGFTFDACVREHQLRELIGLVDRVPEVTIVLDHLGKPNVRERRHQPWFDDLADLARRPNVVTKLSGLTTEADLDSWRPEDVLPYLRHAIEVFGPDRCLYASDWPVATLATSYARWVEVVLDAIADLPADAHAAVLAGTAERVYGLT